MSFQLRQAAVLDLVNIGVQGREEWGEPQMKRYLAKLHHAFETIGDWPKIGRARDEISPGLRSLHEGHHTIYYELDARGHADILRILHEHMDPDTHL